MPRLPASTFLILSKFQLLSPGTLPGGGVSRERGLVSMEWPVQWNLMLYCTHYPNIVSSSSSYAVSISQTFNSRSDNKIRISCFASAHALTRRPDKNHDRDMRHSGKRRNLTELREVVMFSMLIGHLPSYPPSSFGSICLSSRCRPIDFLDVSLRILAPPYESLPDLTESPVYSAIPSIVSSATGPKYQSVHLSCILFPANCQTTRQAYRVAV